MANRHLSRSIVLQTLFEWDFLSTTENLSEGDSLHKVSNVSDEKVKEILDRNLKEFAPGLEDDNFVTALTNQILKKRVVVDEIIEKAAPDWPINKISIIDRNILRIGLTELLFGDRTQVPPKVAINEAIELAKTFGGENSGKFVNGVLGAVYKEIGEPGKDEVSKKRQEKKNAEQVDITKLPVEKKGGGLVYAEHENEVYFAMVHDVFGYWTFTKGGIEEGEDEQMATEREIKEEIGIEVKIEQRLGENQYVASHPEKGKILKKVSYFLARAKFQKLTLEVSGGLDAARWFKMKEIPDLHIYNDIIPLIAKAVEIISKK